MRDIAPLKFVALLWFFFKFKFYISLSLSWIVLDSSFISANGQNSREVKLAGSETILFCSEVNTGTYYHWSRPMIHSIPTADKVTADFVSI